MATPSQAKKLEGVETLHEPSRTDEDKVQTTNRKGNESYSGKKIPCSIERVGSSPTSDMRRVFAISRQKMARFQNEKNQAQKRK